jgi:integrase
LQKSLDFGQQNGQQTRLMRRTSSPDRHLQKRADGGWRYVRRVPGDALAAIRRHDPVAPDFVRRSLDTHDVDEARARRDAMEKADDDRWALALAGENVAASEAYDRAVARARSLRIEYRPAADLAREASLEELVRRAMLIPGNNDAATEDAALGMAGAKSTSLDDAFKVFTGTIRRASLARKSEWQKLKWKQLKERGIANFKKAVGDVPIERIGREDARRFYEFWLARIVPTDPTMKPLSASAGNKDMDTMRALFGEYMAYLGREDVANPFRGLRFEDRATNTRPPFTEAWVRERILAPGALDGLNAEARLVVLALVNTGARPSEITNLDPDRIVLDANIPYIDIRETGERELKARSSARRIPLVGVSLEAMREAAGGFPRYRDKDNLSSAVNKYFVENGLMETTKHTLYSFRHGFEARLKLAEVDEELRRYLMGHAIKRPKYGYSEDLQWALRAVTAVAL